MASEPTVCAILLTKDRPELAARAVRCFRAQTYGRKKLIILNSGKGGWYLAMDWDSGAIGSSELHWPISDSKDPLGRLRNKACELGASADIFCHWDDDEWCHSSRIAEQVAFLQSSGAAVVGYNQMLFWRNADARHAYEDHDTWDGGQSWLYTGPAHQPLGTSLCYWRSTWESHRFDDRKHAGEDSDFLARVGHRRVKSVSSLSDGLCHAGVEAVPREPKMIATVHGANTQQKTYNGFFKGGTVEMKRVAEWDEQVRMTLEGA